MSVRGNVKCTQCGNEINRVLWNYSKNRPMNEFFCNSSCKGDWQKSKRESLGYTKEWLIEQYVNLKRSANDIAREVGRDSKRVWEWLRDYGIETRGRGTDYGQCFKEGCESTFKGKSHSEETRKKLREQRISDGHVPYLKNGIHWLKHKGAISPAWKGGITPDRQYFYSSDEWKYSCKAVWKRANAKCERCGKNHNDAKERGTFHIHHIVSFMVKELRAEVSNLALLCADCHRYVHSKRNVSKEFIGVKK